MCYQVPVLKDDDVEGLIGLEYSIIVEIQLKKEKANTQTASLNESTSIKLFIKQNNNITTK